MMIREYGKNMYINRELAVIYDYKHKIRPRTLAANPSPQKQKSEARCPRTDKKRQHVAQIDTVGGIGGVPSPLPEKCFSQSMTGPMYGLN